MCVVVVFVHDVVVSVFDSVVVGLDLLLVCLFRFCNQQVLIGKAALSPRGTSSPKNRVHTIGITCLWCEQFHSGSLLSL